MNWRESFDVEPMIHQNPIPSATRTGNMLFTSLIAGRDDETGKLPDSADEQAANVFRILRRILERAGATPGEVAHIKVAIHEASVRQFVNKYWLEMFPDENSRPARHTEIKADIAELVQIEAIAILRDRPTTG